MGEKSNTGKILVGKPQKRLGRPRYRWEDIIKMDVREIGRGIWTGFIWLRIETSGGLLLTRQRTFEFHKIL
jgi:hypothetical protein